MTTYARFEYRLFGLIFLQSRIEITNKPTQYRWLGPLVRVRPLEPYVSPEPEPE